MVNLALGRLRKDCEFKVSLVYIARRYFRQTEVIFRSMTIKIHVLIYRNKDFHEVTLEKNGEVLLRFAAAYGFRNIQNMILKLRKGKFPYHFVEVLACPRGKRCSRPVTACPQ